MKYLFVSIILSLFLASASWAQELNGANQGQLLRTGKFILEEIQSWPDHKIPKY